jgi:hypothetical protein
MVVQSMIGLRSGLFQKRPPEPGFGIRHNAKKAMWQTGSAGSFVAAGYELGTHSVTREATDIPVLNTIPHTSPSFGMTIALLITGVLMGIKGRRRF